MCQCFTLTAEQLQYELIMHCLTDTTAVGVSGRG